MSCLMFINGSHLCSHSQINNTLFCEEHKCKIIKSDTCNICLSDMKEFITINCGHCYHKECVGKWLLNNTTCPCCRIVVKTKNEINGINGIDGIDEIDEIDEGFTNWFFSMARTYINNVNDISLTSVFLLTQSIPSEINYFLRIYNNDINNISINLFELELKFNGIANCIRYLYLRRNQDNNYRNNDRNNINNSDSDNDNSDIYDSDNEENMIQYIDINNLEFIEYE